MPGSKLIDLAAATPALTDLLYVVTDPDGTPADKQATIEDVLALAPAGASGGGALVLLEEKVASNVASLDFTSVISSLYDEYQIEILNIVPSATTDLIVQFSHDGGATWVTTGVYTYGRTIMYDSSWAHIGSTTATGVIWAVTNTTDTAAVGAHSGTLTFRAPLDATAYKYLTGITTGRSNGGDVRAAFIFGCLRTATPVTAFRILALSGTLVSGTVRVYGMAKTTAGGGGGSALTVAEEDGTPSVEAVSTLVFAEGFTVADEGDGQVKVSSVLFGPGSGATVVGVGSATGASPMAPAVPGGILPGDLCIFAVQTVNSIPNVAGPTGGAAWTQMYRADTSSNEWQAIYWKIAGGSESAWQITHSAGTETSCACAVYRGPTQLLHSGWNMDSMNSPAIAGHSHGLQVLVFMGLSLGVTIAVPSNGAQVTVTQDVHVASVVSSLPQVWIGHRDTYSPFDAYGFSASGAAGTYGLGFAATFF